MDTSILPVITVKHPKRLLMGHPWVFSNEIIIDRPAKALPQGSVVRLVDSHNRFLGIGYFNPHSLISVRVLSYQDEAIDAVWVENRLRKAAELKDRLVGKPYYRLVHSESDGLPGVICDRFGDVFVVQLNTAGADFLQPVLEKAIQKTFSAKQIIFKQEQSIRRLENIPIVESEASLIVEGEEGPVRFLADVGQGQKTGWFYDQRDNRALFASLCKGKTVLDCYSFTGSFGLYAAKAGAKSVLAIDRSEAALDMVKKNAELNGVSIETRQGEAFDVLAMMDETFDCVMIDPPAVIKVKKDHAVGLKGYTKLVKLAQKCVKPGGILMFTSCSHHATLDDLRGILSHVFTKRGARILKTLCAGPDDPTHPHLVESSYLKGFLLQLD